MDFWTYLSKVSMQIGINSTLDNSKLLLEMWKNETPVDIAVKQVTKTPA